MKKFIPLIVVAFMAIVILTTQPAKAAEKIEAATEPVGYTSLEVNRAPINTPLRLKASWTDGKAHYALLFELKKKDNGEFEEIQKPLVILTKSLFPTNWDKPLIKVAMGRIHCYDVKTGKAVPIEGQ